MMSYTQEQIEEAKADARLLWNIYNSTGGSIWFFDNARKKHDIGVMAKTILAALEDVQKERDDWHRRYDDMLKAKWEEGELAELYRLERCHAEQERDDIESRRIIANMAANSLQEQRDAFAAYAAKLEVIGDVMAKFAPTRSAWDAARKEKP